MLRHKLAVHLVLAKKPVVCWGLMPDWASGRDEGLLTRADVAKLAREVVGRRLRGRAWQLLWSECQSAARCSLHLLFGVSASREAVA